MVDDMKKSDVGAELTEKVYPAQGEDGDLLGQLEEMVSVQMAD